ncbi:hypothetical protein A9261_12755 [Vibrio tasmaniensis]|nr:hypothetical protein A9261_12755 [Vibrio tasmaniensis]
MEVENILMYIKCKNNSPSFMEAKSNIFLNPYSYLVLRKSGLNFNEFDSISIDSYYLWKLLKICGIVKSDQRYSFDNTSFAKTYFNLLKKENRIAIVGSDEKSNEKFCYELKKTHPEINIVYNRNGFFRDDSEKNEFFDRIIGLNIDQIIIGMGSPLQERFIIEAKGKGWQGDSYTCGGFIHQTANQGYNYYPKYIDKFNLRFIYRMYDEPKLIYRYLIEYPKFLMYFIFDLLRMKIYG